MRKTRKTTDQLRHRGSRKASALTSGSGEVALREGPAGAGLEVPLETHRAALIGEFHRGHEPPWTMMGRVVRVSAVVGGDSRRNVGGQSDVVSRRLACAA